MPQPGEAMAAKDKSTAHLTDMVALKKKQQTIHIFSFKGMAYMCNSV